MNEKMMKLEELVKDEAKVAEIFKGTTDEILTKLAANGIELTEEEFNAIRDGMKANNSEILSEEDLDAVAGGCGGCYDFFHKIGKAVDKALRRIFGN